MKSNKIWPITIAIVATALGCKPPASSSDVQAITGNENGEEKALALVAVRNEYDFANPINVEEKPSLKTALEKLNEPVFALVECSSSTTDGQQIKAEAWMNYVEFMSFHGLLYVDKNRSIGYYIKGESKRRSPNCKVLGERMLTLPMVLGASSGIYSLPEKEPQPGTKDYSNYRDEYLMIQGIYLALRGPHSDTGQISVSSKYVALQEAAGNYSSISVSSTSLGQAFIAADEFYNPCYQRPSSGSLSYLAKWRNENFACVNSVVQGLKNYRAGGASGNRYVEVRNKLKLRIGSMYRATFGTTPSTSAEIVNDVMTTTQPWLDIEGKSSSFAKNAAGKTSGGIGFGLAENVDDPFGLELDFEENAETGFSLSSAKNKTDAKAKKTTPQQQKITAEQFMAKLNKTNGMSMDALAKFFQADYGEAAKLKKLDSTTVYNDRVFRETAAKGLTDFKTSVEKYKALLASSNSTLAKGSLIDAVSVFNKSYEGSVEEFSKKMEAARALAIYQKVKNDSGITYFKNAQGDYVTKNTAGTITDYKKLATDANFKAVWEDKTAEKLSNEKSAIDRFVGWDKNGKGFQRVVTSTPTSEDAVKLPGLDFTYGFKPNKPGSSVGTFVADPKLLTDEKNGYQAQLNNLVGAVQKTQGTATISNVNVNQDHIGSTNEVDRQSALTNNWTLFTNGLSQLGQGGMNQQAVTQGMSQINQQQQFSKDANVNKLLDNASTSLTNMQTQNAQIAATGFKDAYAAGSNYFSGAYQAGGSYMGGAAVVANDMKDSFLNMWGTNSTGGGGSANPPAQQPAPVQQPEPAPAVNPAPSGDGASLP